MEIVFFWIEEYYGIKQQGYNLGSSNIFEVVKEASRYKIEASRNERFIANFFSGNEKEERVLNISAIVGENGAGKSLTLDWLQETLHTQKEGNSSSFGFIYIFQDSVDGKLYYQSNLIVTVDPELLIFKLPVESTDDFDIVYFSPILNPKPTFTNFSDGSVVNVSTSRMIVDDWESYDVQNRNKIISDPLMPYRIKNTFRHANLLAAHREDLELKSKGVAVAEGAFVGFDFIAKARFGSIREQKPHREEGGADFDNLPLRFISASSVLYKQWISARQKDQERGSLKLKDSQAKREFLIRDFKMALIMHLAFQLEKSNTWFKEIYVIREKEIEKSQSFNECFEHILSCEFDPGLVAKRFKMDSIDFLPPLDIKDLFRDILSNYKTLLESLDKGALPSQVVNDNAVDVSFDQVQNLLGAYSQYMRLVSSLNGQDVIEFMSFESNKGLSAGEKAYLDIFSRLQKAKDIIQERTDKERQQSGSRTIYLLLDEGEIGYHLRWQRNYVSDLLRVSPKIFNVLRGQVSIQIIFTTHSPVSLSDLPDTNVLYATRLMENQIKVFQKPEVQTFASNVHSLLADSFFMEEGAIGEFAKRNLQLLINTLQPEEVIGEKVLDILNASHEELELRISLIGEPFLRDKLLNMLRSKYDVEFQIMALQQRIEELKSRK
jgi:energy-coupling factor transporter ATP-binding protein EcfA2